MKLGDKVSFKKEIKKVMDGSNYISPEIMEEQELEMKWLDKLKEVQHQKPKVGILVGKRRIAEKTLVEMVEGVSWEGSLESGNIAPTGNGEFSLQATHTEFVNIYLVATNLKGLHRVRMEDLEVIENV